MKYIALFLVMMICSFKSYGQNDRIKNESTEITRLLKKIVTSYLRSHQNAYSYTFFSKYLKDKNITVFDDQVYRRPVPLQEYLALFYNSKAGIVRISIDSKAIRIVKTENWPGRKIFTVIFDRTLNGNTTSVTMIIQAERIGEDDLANFRVMRIINPDESLDRSVTQPFIASMSLGLTASNINQLIAKNIGAVQPLSNIMMLGGEGVFTIGIKGISLLETSRFNFSLALGRMISPTRTWDSIQTNNVTASIADSSLSLSGGSYFALGIDYKLYLYQSLLKLQNKHSWGSKRGYQFDGYLLAGYYWQNYRLNVDDTNNENIQDLRLVGGTFMIGAGVEFWLKSLKYSFFLEGSLSRGLIPRNENLNLFPQSILNVKLGIRLNSVTSRTIYK